MLTVFSDRHSLHAPESEIHNGQLVAPIERPQRAEALIGYLRNRGGYRIVEPDRQPLRRVQAVHDEDYLQFLRTGWEEWLAAGGTGDAYPFVWPARGLRDVLPRDINGRLGYYAFSSDTCLTSGTWDAAISSADSALTAALEVATGVPHAFALCRPPGHHAHAGRYGGYCFLNNCALAAQALIEHDAGRVAIVDVDLHHGNGTQSIFYERADVFTTSLHAEPQHTFPFFLGYADETGAGRGEGCNLNLPLPAGTSAAAWLEALDQALTAVRRFDPAALVVALGVDAFIDDPLSTFSLTAGDYNRAGARIGAIGVPVVAVLEGGYEARMIGPTVDSFLSGLASGEPGSSEC